MSVVHQKKTKTGRLYRTCLFWEQQAKIYEPIKDKVAHLVKCSILSALWK